MSSTSSMLTAAAVVYHSELPVLREFVLSMAAAAERLSKIHGGLTCLYLIDNSECADYFCSLKQLKEELFVGGALQVRLVCAPKNLGYGGANNLLLEGLKSRYHLVINPDVVVDPDALCLAVGFMESNGQVLMLTPRVVDKGGRLCHVVKAYPDCLTLLLRYLSVPLLSRLFWRRLGRYECVELKNDVTSCVEFAGGCFQFLRTESFVQLQGFDDRFFMYFEDFDLSIRTRERGAIAYVPAVKISHAGGDVGRKTFIHHRYFIASALRFFSRHGWRLW